MSENQLVKEIANYLYEGKGWIKFLGVLMIIYGILCCLTIVGALFGWLPILMGIILNKVAGSAEMAFQTGESMHLIESVMNIKKFFMIQGILTLIALILGFIPLLITLALGIFTSTNPFEPLMHGLF